MPAAAVSTGFSSISGTQNGAIEIVYTVVAPPLVPGEAVTPAVGSTVMDLSTITIPFAEPAEVVGNLADVTLGGQAVNAVTMSPDGLTATITSSATFNEGNVTLSIPKGFFKAQNSPSVNDALSYSWNVVKASLGITAPEFIFKGDVANVTLELTNGILFAGFQLDMVLPEGLTVEEITGAPCDFVLSRDNGHIINDGVVDGKIRLLSYGEEAQEYTGNAGTLVTFAVKANDTFEGGNIAISNIKFADREGVKYLLADVASEEIDSRTYVASITIAPTELNLETNETATVEAAVLPEAAFNKTYVWSSSNTDYVTVDENGVVTAVKPTEAENPVYIIATAQDGSNVKAQIPVTVVFTHAANIEVAPNYVNIEAGQTAQLEAVIKDANGAEVATNKTVVWESSNEEVATVDETGLVTLVTAHIVGEAVITATIQGTEISATATVEVKATLAQNITVSPTDIQLETGGTWTLIANVDKNATNRAVVWSVVEGSEDYVSIDAAGEVTALAITPEGTPAQVKATTADGTNLSATANVTVVATLATSVTVEKVDEEASTNLKHTESIELRAVLEGETNKNIVWTADPAEYVDIDVETGIATVTANATVGAVTVYATVENTNVQGFIELNIVKTPVETIAINYDTENQPVKFETGAESFELTATVGPELATDKTYAWSTTDADIAYVDENNQVVFGQKTGEVTLTATANDDAEVYDTLTFNVVYTLAGEIVIASDSADNTLKAGESLTLTATADTNKEIRWSADPEDCVEITVDPETGAATVTALKYVEGGVTIKAQIFEGETPVVTAEQKITLEITRGDVNNDAIVNILDVTVTAAYILGQEVNTFIFAAADLDNDQVIDIADIVRLVRLILDQKSETPEQQAIINRARRFADSSNSLSIEDFEINEGETKQIAIKLDNSKAFSAFQADIYLPEGLEFVDGALSARQSADHVMASTVREDGSVRMLSYSMDLDTYSGSEGDFIYLTVKAEEGFVGDFQIEIDNIVFVQADQSASYFQPVVANVNGVETTGIEDVEGDEFEVKVVGNTIVAPEGAEVYDLNGLRVDAENLAKGIYIVKVGNQIVKVII
ncbi:MAG: Ig-like domain-containing protein [Muribaculaceae bacterium]|nr:Ig-like domain-containing protein [Muribaculaceae bacterium]